MQSGQQGDWDWHYVETGGVKLAANHTDGKGDEIDMGNVQVLTNVDGGYFTDPAKMLAALH